MRNALLTAAILSALAATNASAGWLGTDDCDFTATRSARITASGINHLTVIARAGTLKIEGFSGAAEIAAMGRACASNKSLLDEVKLTSTRNGAELRLEVVIPEDLMMQSASLDLSVTIPRGLPTTVRDGSGESAISGTGNLDVTDGSGALTIHDVAGNLTVQDGSGSIDVEGVTGSVSVTDGSGSIDIRKVGGSVVIPRDGSGSVDVLDVAGNLTVDRKGSGQVSYARVGGHVSVPRR
jgi:hypothetical protein